MVTLGMTIHGTMTTSSKKDYLSILGLSSEFDDIELKKAFRREARKWHPDLNKNDINAEDRFKLINEAYEFLRDPARRVKSIDSNVSNEENFNNYRTGFPEFKDYLNSLFGFEYESELDNESYDDKSSDFCEDEKPDEIFNEEEFNSYDYPARSPDEPPPVKLYQDIETIIELTPDEALSGASILIELEDQTVVEVDTPPFAGDGWRLRLENIAKGGKDHYLQLKVQTENGLRIDGLRVLYKLELFPPDALLGCAVEVPTLDGYVTLQVPPKSSTGRLLRLKGRGLNFGDNIGDQFVEILVVIPADISDEEILKANKSSRSSGAVGPKAITPRMVLKYIEDTGNKDIKILDFGSGKDAKHTYALRDMGLDVTAHDFSANIRDDHHDPNALDRKYDMVFASNVLNVQGSEQMMRRTVEDIVKTLDTNSVFIANFPGSPRYGFQTARESKDILEDYFDVVVIHGSDGGKTSSPVWAMTLKESLTETFKWGNLKKKL